MNAAADKPRMAVNLVTRERAVAAADAFGHVHDQQIDAVDNARLDLAAGGRQDACVCRMRRELRMCFVGRGLQERNDAAAHFLVLAEPRDGDLDHLGSAADRRGVTSSLRACR